MDFYYAIFASFFLFAPWLLFISMILFAGSMDDDQSKERNKGLCTSPGCVRCNRNKQELQQGKESFYSLFRHRACLQRIHEALEVSSNANRPVDSLFLSLRFNASRPLWSPHDLPSRLVEDLKLLERTTKEIAKECDNALKSAYLWRKNEEPATNSCWFTFSLINQGEWQEEQCRCMPRLVDKIHQFGSESLLLDCVFGNVFISMLPAGMQIAEHRGLTNARLRVHLGVEIPPNCEETCFMIVGGKRSNWTQGRCVIFDDSFPHSVNSKNCDEDRIILSLDIWNPELSPGERDCLCRIFPPIVAA